MSTVGFSCRLYTTATIAARITVSIKAFIIRFSRMLRSGAGDTFCANSLNYILEHGMEELTEENLKELLTFANAAASLITTRKGALRVMPTREEIQEFMQNA